METLLGIFAGIGLSAACGFRVFVPLLGLSIASMSGHVTVSSGFEWIGSPVALVAFSIASALEIAAYYIPWVDNLLDVLATPAAIVAGTMAMATVVTDMSPFLTWTLALIAGGGAAAIIQGGTVAARGTSSVTTAGMGNPVFATIELGGALFGTLLAVTLPFVAACLSILCCLWIVRFILKRHRKARRYADRMTAEG